MAGERNRDLDRLMDGVVITLAVASLLMIAYDLNVIGLGRRLAAETQAWLKEQTWRAPAPPPQRKDEQP